MIIHIYIYICCMYMCIYIYIYIISPPQPAADLPTAGPSAAERAESTRMYYCCYYNYCYYYYYCYCYELILLLLLLLLLLLVLLLILVLVVVVVSFASQEYTLVHPHRNRRSFRASPRSLAARYFP